MEVKLRWIRSGLSKKRNVGGNSMPTLAICASDIQNPLANGSLSLVKTEKKKVPELSEACINTNNLHPELRHVILDTYVHPLNIICFTKAVKSYSSLHGKYLQACILCSPPTYSMRAHTPTHVHTHMHTVMWSSGSSLRTAHRAPCGHKSFFSNSEHQQVFQYKPLLMIQKLKALSGCDEILAPPSSQCTPPIRTALAIKHAFQGQWSNQHLQRPNWLTIIPCMNVPGWVLAPAA